MYTDKETRLRGFFYPWSHGLAFKENLYGILSFMGLKGILMNFANSLIYKMLVKY